VQYGFETAGLNRIHASHLTRNPASGRVMQKIGMQHEGKLRQHVRKWEVFEDLEIYGLLKSDYEAR
jgi:RimJ/RimL family protein N-acetyltransferase